MTSASVELRDLGRPEFRTKQDLAAWIAAEAGVDVDSVIEAKRSAARAKGLEWRANDPVTHTRQRLLHRLRTTTIRKADRPVSIAAVTPDPDTASRAVRWMGRG